jgi:hypothetical protein
MTETETDTGLDAGASAPAGDEHLRLDCTIAKAADPGDQFGAAPAGEAVPFAVRNAPLDYAVVSAWVDPSRLRSPRAVAVADFSDSGTGS